jgi:hypothetical protein
MPYHLYEPIKKQLIEAQAVIDSEEFAVEVTLTGTLSSSSFASCASTIYDLSNGSCTLNPIDG